MSTRISRVVTKTGDDGHTAIVGGQRLAKHDARIEAIGAVDELNSQLGLLRAWSGDAEINTLIEAVQQDLFDLGAELAGSAREWQVPDKTARLEAWIEQYNANLPSLKEFILPGGSGGAAYCQVARSVCRRTERRVCAWAPAPEAGRIYLNRLSDLLFVLARVLDARNDIAEAPWQPTRNQ